MNGNSILADTNILIYLLQGNKAVTDYLDGKDVYISFVTELELLSFPQLTTDELKKINQLLSSVKIIDINTSIKKSTIELRSKHKFKLPDSIVLATAGFLNIIAVTADKQLLKAEKEIRVHMCDL